MAKLFSQNLKRGVLIIFLLPLIPDTVILYIFLLPNFFEHGIEVENINPLNCADVGGQDQICLPKYGACDRQAPGCGLRS